MYRAAYHNVIIVTFRSLAEDVNIMAHYDKAASKRKI